MKPTVELTKADRDSHCWKKVEAELNARLKAHRQRVENPEASEADRLGLCWRIRELKELLKLGEEPTKPRSDAQE